MLSKLVFDHSMTEKWPKISKQFKLAEKICDTWSDPFSKSLNSIQWSKLRQNPSWPKKWLKKTEKLCFFKKIICDPCKCLFLFDTNLDCQTEFSKSNIGTDMTYNTLFHLSQVYCFESFEFGMKRILSFFFLLLTF